MSNNKKVSSLGQSVKVREQKINNLENMLKEYQQSLKQRTLARKWWDESRYVASRSNLGEN